ncbi:MAG: MFS transporter, partial [Planctomycetes bacterium]|nr:MFS transporter [Planctomycetota bacterium]
MTSQEAGETTQKLGWSFPRTFWMANVIELFERAAFYGMFITLTLYLTREIKFTDVEA